MLAAVSLLGLWGFWTGPGSNPPSPPGWLSSLEVEETSLEVDLLWPLPALQEPSDESEPSALPGAFSVLEFPAAPAGALPRPEEPGLSSLEIGRSGLAGLRNEPRLFPTVTRALFLPATLAVEGLGLLLPRSLSVNGQTLFDRDASTEDFGTIFARTLVEREIKFLSGLGGTYVATMNVELGLKDYDPQLFNRLQSRVIFDSLKRAYRERYHVPSLDLDTLIDTLSTGQWVDFLVVPAVVSVYAARYGIDRKWTVCDELRVQLHLEKADRFYKFATEKHGGEIGAVGVTLFNLPFSIIVQADRGASRFVDPTFIGIGTDIGTVTQALNGARYGE